MISFDNAGLLEKKFIDKKILPGCALGVSVGGEVLLEQYEGFADIKAKKPVSNETLFEISSLTKLPVIVAAMILFERGEFLINEPIYDFMPEWKYLTKYVEHSDGRREIDRVKNPVLCEHAFTMQIGLPLVEEDSPTGVAMRKALARLKDKNEDYDLQTEVGLMSTVPLAFEPGTHYLRGYAFELVGAMIERISGMDLADFLKQEIFDRLQMNSTGYIINDANRARLAAHYIRDEKLADFVDVSFDERTLACHDETKQLKCATAGLTTTLPDMLKFAQMLANGGELNGERIINAKTVEMLKCNRLDGEQLTEFRTPYMDGYGMGLSVRTNMDNRTSNCPIGEFGWSGKFGSFISIDTNLKVAIVHLQDLLPNEEMPCHNMIRNAVFSAIGGGARVALPVVKKEKRKAEDKPAKQKGGKKSKKDAEEAVIAEEVAATAEDFEKAEQAELAAKPVKKAAVATEAKKPASKKTSAKSKK